MSESVSSSCQNVVELSGFRVNNRHTNSQSRKRARAVSQRGTADLFSMRRHLAYQASVEIDEIVLVKAGLSASAKRRIATRVRALLDKEFGKLRVHRYRSVYVVRHQSVEALISSLLRVQFHANQILISVESDELTSPAKSVSITWGVGRSTSEAEVERLRRKRQKYRQ